MKQIRYRTRIHSSPKNGFRQSWGEYQVLDGRKVIGRYDLQEQALKAHPDAQPLSDSALLKATGGAG